MVRSPEEDTSSTSAIQGGRKRRIGHSIWWVLAVAVIALAVGLFALAIHKDAPAERNTAPISGGLGMVTATHTPA